MLVVLMAVMLVVLAGSGWAAAQEKTMPLGSSEVLDFQGIKRAVVADPGIVDYVVLSAKQIMITAKKPGATDFHVWDEQGQHSFHLAVTAPPSRLPETIRKIEETIANPEIRVSEVNGVIVLEGEVATPYEAQRAAAIASAYTPNVQNLIQVRPAPAPAAPAAATGTQAIEEAVGPGIKIRMIGENTMLVQGTATPEQKARLEQIINALPKGKGATGMTVIDMVSAPGYVARQILVHVKVVDVDKTAASNIGIDWGGLTRTSEGLFTAHDQPILFGEFFTGRQPVLNVDEGGPLQRLDGISAQLQALVTDNKARILAEPDLLVREGENASLLVGGEIPVPVVQTVPIGGGAATAAVTIQWKEFGVRLEIVGHIGVDGKAMDLDVAPEVSQLDFTNAIVISGFAIPALRSRRAHSVVHIGDGQTLVIGGLYQSDYSKVVKKIPLLGDIPIIGEFFKHTVKSRTETELMIFVTPEIVTEASAQARTDAAMKKIGEVK
jgi:pilus assembly protein CpaC